MSEPVPLTKKSSWVYVLERGDYAWEEDPRNLYLMCPFCRRDSPLPPELPILQEEPLTVDGYVTCGFCDVVFSIRDGKALRYEDSQQQGDTPPR